MPKTKNFDKETKNKISLAIRRNRTDKDWSQDNLAEYSGVDRTTIAHIEARKSDARTTTLRKLALAFKKSLSEFLADGDL